MPNKQAALSALLCFALFLSSKVGSADMLGKAFRNAKDPVHATQDVNCSGKVEDGEQIASVMDDATTKPWTDGHATEEKASSHTEHTCPRVMSARMTGHANKWDIPVHRVNAIADVGVHGRACS